MSLGKDTGCRVAPWGEVPNRGETSGGGTSSRVERADCHPKKRGSGQLAERQSWGQVNLVGGIGWGKKQVRTGENPLSAQKMGSDSAAAGEAGEGGKSFPSVG